MGHTDAVGVVKVVVLFAVCVETAGQGHVGEFVSARWSFFVLAFDAVEISVEETGIAVVAEEDQRVGEGLEETFDWCLDCLTLLRVVVLHNRLTSD